MAPAGGGGAGSNGGSNGGKKRKGALKDFSKVKHKIGRKLKPSANETSTAFRAARISIPSQLQHTTVGASDDVDNDAHEPLDNNKSGDPASRSLSSRSSISSKRCERDLALAFPLLGHSTPAARRNALASIREIVSQDKRVLKAHATTIVVAAAAACADGDASVRKAALELLRSEGIRGVAPEALKPCVHVVVAHAKRAMASDVGAISKSGRELVESMCDAFPRALQAHRDDIFGAYADVLERRGDSALAPMSARSLEAGEAMFAAAARFANASMHEEGYAASLSKDRRDNNKGLVVNAFACAERLSTRWGIRLDRSAVAASPTPPSEVVSSDYGINTEGNVGASRLASHAVRFIAHECLRGLSAEQKDDDAKAHANAAASATLHAAWLLCTLPHGALAMADWRAIESVLTRTFPLVSTKGSLAEEANAALLAVLGRAWHRGGGCGRRGRCPPQELLVRLLSFAETYLAKHGETKASSAASRPTASRTPVMDSTFVEGVRILAEMDELWPPGDTNATRRAKLLQCVEALAFDAPRSAMGRGVLLSLCHRWLVVVGKWHNAEARVALSALAERHAAGFPRALHRLGTTDVALSSTVLSALLNICAAVPVPSNLEDALVPLFAVELDAGRVAYGPFARWPAQLQETACAVAQRAVAGDDGAGELAKAVNLAALRIGTRS